MRLFSLMFLAGILLLQQFSHLPASQWIWLILPFAIIANFSRFTRIPGAFALGFIWALWFAYAQMSWKLPDNFEGKTVVATGYISSIPDTSDHMSGFIFALKKLQLNEQIKSGSALVKLSWRGDVADLHVGDQWQLALRLKKVYGSMNPGGFDYEGWALQEGIRANGYVVNKGENKLLSSHWYHAPLNRIREYLKIKIEKNLPVSHTSPWITALALGERRGIDESSWEVLRNTGTNHLMAIAGLHIGFMSGLAFAIMNWLWRRSERLTLRFPAQHAGAVAALVMALIYSAMAGFSIPTQRACIMLAVFMTIILLRRKIISWHAWSWALLIVLLINPLSVLTESFWLSFGAVALIIYGVSGRLAAKGLWWKWGRIQWVIAVGLVPFSVWLFQQCSLVSFLANSIAIPWVGFLIVPLCFFGTFLLLFSGKLGGLVLILADKLLSYLWVILTWFANLSWASWYQVVPNHWVLIAACIGMIIILLPAGFPGRYLGVIWFLPLIFFHISTPKLGEMDFTLLDVGQGLSAVVQTQNHILVFDTGAKLGPSYDMGESVVVPFLRSLNTKKIDMLVVSHGDNDHIGGAPAILKHFHVTNIKTSVPEKLPSAQTTLCLQGEKWEWDNVKFEFLYPTPDNLGLNNDSSCVLRVTVANQHVLLTGDIEKWAENVLTETQLRNLSSDILVAPHHGSKTSAQQDFLEAVMPKYVLFPLGYRNRYRFPHVSVVAKYNDLGVKKMDTAKSGAIKIVLNEKMSEPSSYRHEHHRYWNN